MTTGSDISTIVQVSFELGHAHNGQDLIAAQITKLYKFERERGRRDNKSFSGVRDTIDGRTLPFGSASKGFTRLRRDS